MAEGSKIWRMCPYCIGKGQKDVSTIEGAVIEDCEWCDATGYIFFGWKAKEEEIIPANLPDPPA